MTTPQDPTSGKVYTLTVPTQGEINEALTWADETRWPLGRQLEAERVRILATAYRAKEAEAQAYREALIGSKRKHDECEDRWYSCPKSAEGCLNDAWPADRCTCGADDHNAAIDAVLSKYPEGK
jgi:hypothetical protein